jgi:putative oxidoreductase
MEEPMGLFRTHRNWAALFCRIAIAAVFIPHGLDKLVEYEPLGWRGPVEWAAAVQAMIPARLVPEQYQLLLAQASAWAELVAGISCVLGLLVRLCVLPLIVDMFMAILLVHGKNGFWINHKVDGILQPGFEYNMVLILICFGLLFSGAGSLSLDKLIGGESDFEEYEEDIEYEEEPIRQ